MSFPPQVEFVDFCTVHYCFDDPLYPFATTAAHFLRSPLDPCATEGQCLLVLGQAFEGRPTLTKTHGVGSIAVDG